MGHYIRSQLVTRDKLKKIPYKIIHFSDGDYIHFPLKIYYDMEDVMNEFGKYATIDELIKNKSLLSGVTLEIVDLIEKLEINSFLIEYLEDVGDWYPLSEFLQFIVKERVIFKESLVKNVDEDGDLYCESILGYDYNYKDDFFTDYSNAEKKYLKKTE